MKLEELAQFRWVDLTHSLHPKVPTWNGSCGFHQKIVLDYNPSGLRVHKIEMHAGIGTHLDAPAHFKEGIGCDISQIPLKHCFGPLCILDLRKKRNPDLFVNQQDLEEYEKTFGKIPKGAFVVAYTGWDEFWGDCLRYRNPDQTGKMHFPGFSGDAIPFLLKREIHGIGIDTLSPDGSSDSFPVHEQILGAKKLILENLTHLSEVPSQGAYMLFLPPKILEATEAIVRVIAICPP